MKTTASVASAGLGLSANLAKRLLNRIPSRSQSFIKANRTQKPATINRTDVADEKFERAGGSVVIKPAGGSSAVDSPESPFSAGAETTADAEPGKKVTIAPKSNKLNNMHLNSIQISSIF